MRKFLIGLGGFVVLLIVLAFIGPSLIPADSVKQDIAREVEAATGRSLTIDGDLNFTLLPAPGVSVSGLRLSNPDGASRPDMVRLRAASVEVALLPLLGGDVQVDRIVLDAPDIVLEQYADGTNNWTFQPAGAENANGAGEPGGGGGGDGAGAGPAVRFDNVVIRDGTVVWRTPDSEERIEDIDMALGAGSLDGPFRAQGSLRARGTPVTLQAAVGALAEERATPVSVTAELAGGEVSYSGVMAGWPDAPRLAGQVRVSGGDAGAMVAALTGAPAPAPLAGAELNLDGKLAASASAVSVNDLSLRMAGMTATGAVDIGLEGTPSIDAIINVGHIELDQLTGAGTTPAGSGGEASQGGSPGGGGTAAGSPEADGGASGLAGLTLPMGIEASVETKVETIAWRGGVIRQARFNAQLAEGTLNVSQASAQLPGGASVSLVGFAAPRDGQPSFEGQMEASADDFRALLSWLGADVADVPPERLRKMAGSARISAAPENVTITDIDVSVDVSRLRGGIAIAPRERPGFGIGLSLDKINLDAYLPADDATGTGAAPTDDTAAPAANAGGTPQDAASGAAAGLAVLDSFDAIAQLKAGEITIHGQQIRGLNFDGTLQGGNLELRDLTVQSLAGARANASGQINDLAGAPVADLTLDIDAASVERLLELAGTSAPFPVGKGRLTGSVKGNLDDADLDLSLTALDAKLGVAGTVAPLATPPAFDVDVTLTHPDAAALAAAVGGGARGDMPAVGALDARLALDGGLAASDIDARIGLGDGSLTAKGRLENLLAGGPTGTLALDAAYPELVSLIRLFAPDYRPALGEAGPFRLTGDVALAPDSVSIGNLDGTAGPVGYRGSVQVATGGPRPAVTASLSTSEIIADWFLPPRARGTVTPNQAGGGSGAPSRARWSSEPLDLSALRMLDADISLTAPAITYTDVRVDEPKLVATLKDGVLDLTQLTGRAYGGPFEMTGQVVAADTPQVRYTMSVSDADAAGFIGGKAGGDRGVMSVFSLLFPASDLNVVSGRVSADIDVASRGRSEYDLIASLDGTGGMRFTDAVVEGVDVCRISNQFGNLNGLEGFLGLAVSTRGGQTTVNDFQGSFTLEDGVATLPQQTIDADCADITFSGTANLPQWLVDITARAVFPEHPEFPGVVVEQKGPLDAPNTRLVNLNDINRFVAGKAAGTALRKLLPGQQSQESGGSGQQQQQPQQSAPPRPEEQFKNLLDNLIRR